MNSSISKFNSNLQALNPDDDGLITNLYKLIELLEETEEAESVIPEIFKFMEKNPLTDIGIPGPLTHFIENYYPNYVEMLINSIKTKPSIHTVFMAQRILNSELAEETRSKLITALESTLINNNSLSEVKVEAEEVIKLNVK